MALSTRRMLWVIATVALGAAFVLTFTSLVASADSNPAEASKKKKKKKKKFVVGDKCSKEHEPFPPAGRGRDFADVDVEVDRRTKAKAGHAAALVAVKGAKVSATFTDLTPLDGDNAVDKIDSDRTDSKGVAELTFKFNNFGDYEVKYKVSKKGYKTKNGSVKFHVKDRTSGPCAVFT